MSTKSDNESIKKKKSNTTIRECNQCGKQSKELKTCGKCKRAYYCTIECQKKHWIKHKTNCDLTSGGSIREAHDYLCKRIKRIHSKQEKNVGEYDKLIKLTSRSWFMFRVTKLPEKMDENAIEQLERLFTDVLNSYSTLPPALIPKVSIPSPDDSIRMTVGWCTPDDVLSEYAEKPVSLQEHPPTFGIISVCAHDTEKKKCLASEIFLLDIFEAHMKKHGIL